MFTSVCLLLSPMMSFYAGWWSCSASPWPAPSTSAAASCTWTPSPHRSSSSHRAHSWGQYRQHWSATGWRKWQQWPAALRQWCWWQCSWQWCRQQWPRCRQWEWPWQRPWQHWGTPASGTQPQEANAEQQAGGSQQGQQADQAQPAGSWAAANYGYVWNMPQWVPATSMALFAPAMGYQHMQYAGQTNPASVAPELQVCESPFDFRHM